MGWLWPGQGRAVRESLANGFSRNIPIYLSNKRTPISPAAASSIAFGKAAGYEVSDEGFSLSGKNYFKRFTGVHACDALKPLNLLMADS